MIERAAPVFDFATRPDISEFMAAASTGRRQPLAGFDPDYVDIVDYIVRCTHKIWEEGAVGLIYSHYSHNCAVHTASGMIYGAEAMVKNTLRRQAAFPDRRPFADDVIWGGDETAGFYSSHRVYSVGTNTGPTDYGPATGRKVARWGVADCIVKGNRIVEEWLAHDSSAELRQMGFDPLELARRLPPFEPPPEGDLGRTVGQLGPELLPVPSANEPEAHVAAVLHNLWNGRMVNLVREHYAPNHLARVPGGRELRGWGDYAHFVFSLLGSFPDLFLTVDHQCHVGDERRGYRVATRWTMMGTHEGPGRYGEPTGRRIAITGMTHHLLEHGRFTQEWTVFDELALLRHLHGGSVSP